MLRHRPILSVCHRRLLGVVAQRLFPVFRKVHRILDRFSPPPHGSLKIASPPRPLITSPSTNLHARTLSADVHRPFFQGSALGQAKHGV